MFYLSLHRFKIVRRTLHNPLELKQNYEHIDVKIWYKLTKRRKFTNMKGFLPMPTIVKSLNAPA